ncbi:MULTISPECIES: DUF4184 family protein [Streptomyces]|uniref:DUF4184 domain-containing protein n=1 Tax=Streptomyces venezuelae (strain ATCC 10712 / CBS 650.69 / DSM 40230 / JCM 4526 / NBRC 13096 / PD 04745) TaxID=953739 RepID=F2RGV5_STRVP|nr:DUF4184 family protein [Streptomyces venezuelae]QER98353.1 DUF4184 family protein [Streptomyces venezuelae ATCC 10712]CCA54916.1 hypothetical protein SVEN_1629 [Streptomyces venezuelae ATCC 10712]
MPFTLSHAAAVLPGLRRDGTARGPLVASGLVAGSFAPDMTYFAATAFPGAMTFGDVTHSPVGIVTVDVLITGSLVALWLVVREPLVALLPARWRGRVYGLVRGRAWRERHPALLAGWFGLSAVLGATTHVVWDSFTHLDRWGTRALPVLGDVVAGFPFYLYVQYGSSALALGLLAWCAARALRSSAPGGELPAGVRVPGRRGRLLAAGLIGGCVLAGVAHRVLRWAAYWGWDRIETPLDVIPTACFGAGAGLAVGLVLYGTGVRLRGAWPAPVPEAPAGPPPPPVPGAGEGTGRPVPSERSRRGSR